MSSEDFLPFNDLYIPDDHPEKGFMYPGALPIPSEMSDLVDSLLKIARSEGKDYTAKYGNLIFRGHRKQTIEGAIHIFRRSPTKIRTLEETGIPSIVITELRSPRLSAGGLVLVCGQPGNGKSTTCAAVLVDRLIQFGGVAITVEDPVEMPLQGEHGKGRCLQTNLSGKDDYPEAIRDTMRDYPTGEQAILMVGEVRDAETAALVLKSGVDGRLVLTTVHGADVASGLQRILSLATHTIGEEEARSLLASSFRLAMHQKLDHGRLRVTCLMDTRAVVGRIMGTTPLSHLTSDIQFQMNQLRLGQRLELRP